MCDYFYNVRNGQHENVYKAFFAVFLFAARYCIIVDNAYWLHRRQNYTVIATKIYWQNHHNFHTIAKGTAVCLRLTLEKRDF